MSQLSQGLKKAERWIGGKIPHTAQADIRAQRYAVKDQMDLYQQQKNELHAASERVAFDQYKQLVSQATMGDFSAAEFKQLMETINIGCRAFESFELQKQVEQMKADLEKMNQNNVHNIIPIKEIA